MLHVVLYGNDPPLRYNMYANSDEAEGRKKHKYRVSSTQVFVITQIQLAGKEISAERNKNAQGDSTNSLSRWARVRHPPIPIPMRSVRVRVADRHSKGGGYLTVRVVSARRVSGRVRGYGWSILSVSNGER